MLADEAGEMIGKLQKQVNELQGKIEAQEARAKRSSRRDRLASRATAKRLLSRTRKSVPQIEGSLSGRPSVN